MCGTIGIAISTAGGQTRYYDDAARFAVQLGETVFQKGLPFGTFLNVNMPNLPLEQIAGVRISRQGVTLLTEFVDKRTDPRNQIYFWQGPDMQTFGEDPAVDGAALDQRYISITPVKCDMTDYQVLKELVDWDVGKWLKEAF